MIEFTIKTLDSKDHRFSVDDEITVAQLKEKVLEQMGVEIGLQRLIFCGRVLQDEKKLADYGVNGKVVHMVQRAPPCLESHQSALRERERDRERQIQIATQMGFNSDPINPVHINHTTQQQIRRLVALAATAHGIEIEDQPGVNLSPTASRLEFLRHIIDEIKASLEALKLNESDEPRNYPSDDPLESTSSLGASGSANDELDSVSGTTRESRGRRIRSMRPSYHTPPRDFAALVAELQQLDSEFSPFRETYIMTLRDANDSTIHLDEETLQRRQRSADLCAELYHSFSHAYHTVSDIGLLLTHGNSRLTSEALLRPSLPLQAHINVVQSSTTRRPLNPTATVNGTNQQPAESQGIQFNSSQAGRNTNQPTVNINIQPDPITYQLEIETRVPIPINLQNVINGADQNAAQGENNQNQNQGQNQGLGQSQGQTNGQSPGQGQTPDQGQSPDQGSGQGQGQGEGQNQSQDGQANRRQIMIDFENLFRGLGQGGGMGGVEVVMSMEEIPQALGGQGQNNNTATTGASQPADGSPQQHYGSQVYLAQMPWSELPHGDLVQNIVSSVLRHGFPPGIEGFYQLPNVTQTLDQTNRNQSQTPGQTLGQSQGQSQTQTQDQNPQDQGQTQSQTQNQTQSQTPGQGLGQGLSQGQGQSQTQTQGQFQPEPQIFFRRIPSQTVDQENQNSSEQSANTNSTNRPRQSIVRIQQPQQHQPARPRSQTLSINTLVYDRFLNCDSPHARRQLQRRRAEASQAGGLLLRDNSLTRIQNSVETLFERFDRNTNNDESLLIAAVVTLREATSFSSGRTLVVEELLPLRQRLQVFMRELMNGEYEVGTQEQLADLIFERHSGFINRIASITPIRRNVDIVESMKAVFIRFLNEAMTVLDIENNDVFTRRFRIVIPRMFYELCGVISYCCLEGVEGLRTIYRSFLTDLIQNIDEPVRDLLHSLSMENLNAAICRIEANKIHYAQFIRRKPVDICNLLSDSEDSSPMDEDVPNRGERMQFLAPSQSAAGSSMAQFPYPSTSSKKKSNDESRRNDDSGDISDSESTSASCSTPGSSSAPATPSATPSPTVPPVLSIPSTPTAPTVPPAPSASTSASKASSSPAPNAPSAPSEPKVPEASDVPEASAIQEVSATPEVSAIPEVSANAGVPVTAVPMSIARNNTSASEPMRVPASVNFGRGRFNRVNRSGSTTSSDSSGSIRFVPPAQIAQHWGEDWVPTFTRDLQRQRDTAEPYSDAYLSGMPPKKRRCVRQSRPPTTLNAFINESVSEVSSECDEAQGEELRVAFREHVRCIARARAAASEDYEPRRLVATARFLNQNRTSTRKSPEKTNSE